MQYLLRVLDEDGDLLIPENHDFTTKSYICNYVIVPTILIEQNKIVERKWFVEKQTFDYILNDKYVVTLYCIREFPITEPERTFQKIKYPTPTR